MVDRYFLHIRGDEPRDVFDIHPCAGDEMLIVSTELRVQISVKYACSPQRLFTITQKLVFLVN